MKDRLNDFTLTELLEAQALVSLSNWDHIFGTLERLLSFLDKITKKSLSWVIIYDVVPMKILDFLSACTKIP